MGAYFGLMKLPDYLAARRLDRRLREVSRPIGSDLPDTPSFVTEVKKGPLPAIDRALGGANSSLATLIEQSGVRTTPSAIMLAMVLSAVVSGLICMFFVKVPIFWIVAAVIGSFIPYGWLRHKRATRMKRFEEQFPEALDLLSRAIRAGHAFQTAMGMVAEELPVPVGIEFKKAFEQQNFGLPLRDVLDQMAERVPHSRRQVLRDRGDAFSARPAATSRRFSTTSRTSCASASRSCVRFVCIPRTAASRGTSCWRFRRPSPSRSRSSTRNT